MKAVYLECIDSVTEGGWIYKEEAIRKARDESMICYHVGYVLDEDERYLLLTSGYMANGDSVSSILQIPKVAILEKRELDLSSPTPLPLESV